MSILFSGDFHANADKELPLITKENLIKHYSQKFYDEIKYHVIIDGKITCRQWFCDHLHRDRYYYDEELERGYQYLYRKTSLLCGDKTIII